jgi:glyoxylase-like metal-dependent hydrolase (beta-lactamase superfamily II)
MRISPPKTTIRTLSLACAAFAFFFVSPPTHAGTAPPDATVTIVQKAVNGVCIEYDGRRLVVYGDPERQWQTADMVLFTHARRDVAWAGRALVGNGARAVVPAAQEAHFTKVDDFWTAFWGKRFHDYAQQSTRVLTRPLRVDRTVRDGDTLAWHDLTIEVVATPGYTRGAVSFFVDLDGTRYGFVGDTIYGNGHFLDLYSLQDEVEEARIGGYHGYAGRIGDLIGSLRRIAAKHPDVMVPARGPVIRRPDDAIARLIERLRAAYRNYLSINAGRWYFRERYDVLAERAFGTSSDIDWMPYARTVHQKPPAWIVPIHNSRLILAADRSGFLVDCGSRAIIEELRALRETDRLMAIEGLFITHYHDDHTDKVREFLTEFDCPVYVTPILADVLRHPGAYRLPAMTASPIKELCVVPDGARRRWKEFTLTFYDYPGQTIYHDAMLAERQGGQSIFFVGDSFTPSGLDDYCLLNRNIIREAHGYLYCLRMLQRRVPTDAMLINEHVVEPFRYDAAQISHMIATLKERRDILADLFPWDEPNYGIDERWARLSPYGQTAEPGDRVEWTAIIWNHSAREHTFTVTLNPPAGFKATPPEASVTVAPGRQAQVHFDSAVPATARSGVFVFTADIRFDQWDLRQWSEGLLKIAP